MQADPFFSVCLVFSYGNWHFGLEEVRKWPPRHFPATAFYLTFRVKAEEKAGCSVCVGFGSRRLVFPIRKLGNQWKTWSLGLHIICGSGSCHKFAAKFRNCGKTGLDASVCNWIRVKGIGRLEVISGPPTGIHPRERFHPDDNHNSQATQYLQLSIYLYIYHNKNIPSL